MPTSGPTTVPPAPGPSAAASLTAISSVAKADTTVKQIAICAIQSPGSAAAPVAPQTRAPVSSGQLIGSAGAVTQLNYIFNRFAPDGRQAVLLQPRGSAGQPVVVTTSNASTPGRYIQIPQHHTIRSIVPAVPPVSRNNSIQIMNLSVSNPTPSGTVQHAKAATVSRPFGAFPLEVGLVLQNPSDQTVRPIRLQTAAGQTVTGKAIAARAPQPKVISLTTTGNSVAAPGRHNILLGTAVAAAGATGKPAILNQMKSGSAVIINPNSGQLNSGTGNFNSHPPHHPAKSALIPVNSAIMTIAGGPRHHPISAAAFPASQRVVSSHQQHVVSISGGPAMRSGVLTTSGSPLKQPVPAATPASPRPSILNRKRVVPDVRPANPLLTPTKCKQEAVKAEVTDEEPAVERVAPLSQDQQPATPRKKPRKQLLEPFDLSATHLKLLNCENENRDVRAAAEECEEDDRDREQEHDPDPDQDQDQEETDDASQEEMDCDEEDDEDESFSTSSPSAGRKPRISLFPCHPPNWKALQHHFLRYTDVKPKAEKKLTLSELSNEGLQKKNGWKIHHLATQMEDMSDNETELLHRLNQCLRSFEQRIAGLPLMRDSALSPDCPFRVSLGDKLADLLRGNIQRSSLFQEQMAESKQLLIKLTNDHRERVGKLTKKNINKRTCISK